MTKNVRSFRTMLRLFPEYQQPCLHISSESLLNRPLLPRLPSHLSFRSPSPGFRSLIGTWWLGCPCGPSDPDRNAHQGHPRRATSVHWNLCIGKLVQLSTLGTSQRHCAPCSCTMNIVFDNGDTQNTFEQIFGILILANAVNNQQLIQNMTEIIVYVSFKRQSL